MTATAIDPRLAMGANNPPSVTEMVQAELADKHAPLIQRKDEIMGSVSRAPAEVTDDDTAGRHTELIRAITSACKVSENARTSAKEPHLEAGRAVDGWFKKHFDPLLKAKADLTRPLEVFLRQKADKERREREAAAAKAAAEAARQAAEIKTEADVDQAIAQQERAEKAVEAAQVKPAELARTRGDFGGLATLQTRWKHEVTDQKLVPLEYQMVNDMAIKAAIKAGVRAIPGVRIYEDQSAMVR